MSSWSAKLERVRFLSPAEGGAASDFGKSPATAAATPAESASLPNEGRLSLDALRDRIAEILTRAPPAKKRFADPALGDLPFVREETALGALYVRTKRLSAAHRVGRAPVQAGKRASAGMLALLSLDPAIAALDPARALYI